MWQCKWLQDLTTVTLMTIRVLSSANRAITAKYTVLNNFADHIK
jgi:hypothetical protein